MTSRPRLHSQPAECYWSRAGWYDDLRPEPLRLQLDQLPDRIEMVRRRDVVELAVVKDLIRWPSSRTTNGLSLNMFPQSGKDGTPIVQEAAITRPAARGVSMQENNRVSSKRIGLIGHSGSGKTTCVDVVGHDLSQANMDSALKVTVQTPFRDAKAWLLTTEQPIVAVSPTDRITNGLHHARESGNSPELFAKVEFVYLFKPLPLLRQHLEHATPRRPPVAIKYTLDNYDRFHALYSKIADRVIDCTTLDTLATAAMVRQLVALLVSPVQLVCSV